MSNIDYHPTALAISCRGRPLKQAVQECELRWFHETAVLAKEGEANQMALLGVCDTTSQP
jgi:hypothetical protein